jgi:hypothetical protein
MYFSGKPLSADDNDEWPKEAKEEILKELNDKSQQIEQLKEQLNEEKVARQKIESILEKDKSELRAILDDDEGYSSYRLHPNTPKYRGRIREDLDTWLFIVKCNLEAAMVPESRKLSCIALYVKDYALSVLMNFKQKFPNGSFDDFIAELKSRTYFQGDIQFKKRNEMVTIRQNGPIEDYIYKFLGLSLQAKESEEFELCCFVKGLRSKEAAIEVKKRKPETLREAMEIATLFEHCMETDRESNEKARKEWWNCHRLGHIAKNCYHAKNRAKRSQSEQC